MQDRLYYELGVVFPKVIWTRSATLRDGDFRVKVNDLNMPSTPGLKTQERLVNATLERLRILGVQGSEAVSPDNGNASAVIHAENAKACEAAGLTTWDPVGYMIFYVSSVLRKHAGCFLTADFVNTNLEQLRKIYPSLVDAALDRFRVQELTWILRELVDEELSIRNLRDILNCLVLVNGTIRSDLSSSIVLVPEGTYLVHSGIRKRRQSELEFDDYSNYLRSAALRRYISHKYTRWSNTLIAYLLDPAIEARLRDAHIRPLSGQERQQIVDATHEEVGSLPPADRYPVVLTTADIRGLLRRLIDIEFPHLAVLSYDELSPDLKVQPISRIALPDQVTEV